MWHSLGTSVLPGHGQSTSALRAPGVTLSTQAEWQRTANPRLGLAECVFSAAALLLIRPFFTRWIKQLLNPCHFPLGGLLLW